MLLELPLLVSAPEEPLEEGMLLELPLLVSAPEEPLEEGMLLELPLLVSAPEEPLEEGMLLELPLLLSDPEEPLLSMLLPAAAPLVAFCFELLALCFFLVARGLVCVSVSAEVAPAALLSALLPEDFSPLSCCIRNSSARCSTAAARAGSVVLEMPLSELCA